MEILAVLFAKTLEVFQTELTLWGFTFSYWEVFVFTIVSGLICWIVGTILSGD